MDNKLDRLLFFWLPILSVFLYSFSLVLEINLIKKAFSALPIWGWLTAYFVILFLVKKHLKSLNPKDDPRNDYTAKAVNVSSDVIIVFIFSIISFVLIMILLGNSLESAINLSR